MSRMASVIESLANKITNQNQEAGGRGSPTPSENGSDSSVDKHRWSAERQLAIASIKANAVAVKFDGEDASVYRRWKASLEDELGELDVPPRVWLEILELRTISVANDMVKRAQEMEVDDPVLALKNLWEVLDRRYRSHPQAAIKLLSELQNFPKISVKQPDILWAYALACQQAEKLMETEQGKQLGVLDFPDSQKLVTERLDESLWEKWKTHGTKKSAYPGDPIPFKTFADWIFKIAEANSDPNFIRKTVFAAQTVNRGSYNPPKALPKLPNRTIQDPRAPTTSARPYGRGYGYNNASWKPSQPTSAFAPSTNQASSSSNFNKPMLHLSTHLDSSGRNTDNVATGAPIFRTAQNFPDTSRRGDTLATIAEVDESSPLDISAIEFHSSGIERWCAVCGFTKENPHDIHGCQTFHRLSFQERHTLAGQKQLCFGCLDNGHQVRDCPTRPVRCGKCSMAHNELIGCSTFAPTPPNAVNMNSTASSTKGSTYSRTCAVLLSHRSNPEITVKGLAIIDEGAAITLVGKDVLSRLTVPRKDFSIAPMQVITVDRTTPVRMQRSVKGLRVAPIMDPASYAEISECIEWKNLQHASNEVATPEEVSQIPEFEHLEGQFPHVDSSWPTLVLLGRDSLWAMQHKQFIPPLENGPMAVHTPLGWALVGPKRDDSLASRAGLKRSYKSQRDHNLPKKKYELLEQERDNKRRRPPTKEMEIQNREQGLQKPLDATNRGFEMLKRMGYKEGESLGQSNTGRVEPILPMEVKTSRSGLGREDAVRRQRRAEAEAQEKERAVLFRKKNEKGNIDEWTILQTKIAKPSETKNPAQKSIGEEVRQKEEEEDMVSDPWVRQYLTQCKMAQDALDDRHRRLSSDQSTGSYIPFAQPNDKSNGGPEIQGDLKRTQGNTVQPGSGERLNESPSHPNEQNHESPFLARMGIVRMERVGLVKVNRYRPQPGRNRRRQNTNQSHMRGETSFNKKPRRVGVRFCGTTLASATQGKNCYRCGTLGHVVRDCRSTVGETHREDCTISNDMAGAIIGPSGSIIQQIRLESGTEIKIGKSDRASGERIVSVTGSAENIQLAKYLMQQAVGENAESDGQAEEDCSYGNGENDVGLLTEDYVISYDMAGAMIGPGGSRIQQIRLESRAEIRIVESDVNGQKVSGKRILSITGGEENVQLAMYLLQQAVRENEGREDCSYENEENVESEFSTGQENGGDLSITEITFPYKWQYKVQIRQIELESRTRIEIEGSKEKSGNRTVLISGSRKDIRLAQDLLQQMVGGILTSGEAREDCGYESGENVESEFSQEAVEENETSVVSCEARESLWRVLYSRLRESAFTHDPRDPRRQVVLTWAEIGQVMDILKE